MHRSVLGKYEKIKDTGENKGRSKGEDKDQSANQNLTGVHGNTNKYLGIHWKSQTMRDY